MITKKKLLPWSFVLMGLNAFAQTDSTTAAAPAMDNSMFDMSIEQLLGLDKVDTRFKLYGYIDTYAEKTFGVPYVGASGKTGHDDVPFEWTPARNFHLYGSGNLNDNIDVLFNVARTSSDGLELRNAWGNFMVKSKKLQVRVGKMYRRFGLYNEKLDQTPTFIGIEPPELFDVDHLFLTRTTNFMVHGSLGLGKNELLYSFSTENPESGAAKNVVPLGLDFRYKTYNMIIGTSGFMSSLDASKGTGSTVKFGSGSARGGVLPWMQSDNYSVIGAFVEKQLGNFLVQAEYWVSPHQGTRNANNVLSLVKEGDINAVQRKRFLGNAAGNHDSTLTTADVVTNVSYVATTWYVRIGYSINTKIGQFMPYVFMDYMTNPEIVNNKKYGGDEESGFADDGVFYKPSLGLVYRPIQNVAIKLDGSTHTQNFNGRSETYSEVRLDFSFAFKQWMQ